MTIGWVLVFVVAVTALVVHGRTWWRRAKSLRIALDQKLWPEIVRVEERMNGLQQRYGVAQSELITKFPDWAREEMRPVSDLAAEALKEFERILPGARRDPKRILPVLNELARKYQVQLCFIDKVLPEKIEQARSVALRKVRGVRYGIFWEALFSLVAASTQNCISGAIRYSFAEVQRKLSELESEAGIALADGPGIAMRLENLVSSLKTLQKQIEAAPDQQKTLQIRKGQIFECCSALQRRLPDCEVRLACIFVDPASNGSKLCLQFAVVPWLLDQSRRQGSRAEQLIFMQKFSEAEKELAIGERYLDVVGEVFDQIEQLHSERARTVQAM